MRVLVPFMLVVAVMAVASPVYAQHARRHPRGDTAPMRWVQLSFAPSGVMYSIDGGPSVQYGPPASRRIQLRVGMHIFRVTAYDSECEEASWTEEISAGEETLRIIRLLHCR